MCPVLRSATAIKMKSRDQAHRQATIKGSRRLLDQKSDQNQDNFAMSCILLNTCYKLSTVVHQHSGRNHWVWLLCPCMQLDQTIDNISKVQITVDQGSKGALRPDQAIKSQFQRSKLLIAVADRSTGHIAVTTP